MLADYVQFLAVSLYTGYLLSPFVFDSALALPLGAARALLLGDAVHILQRMRSGCLYSVPLERIFDCWGTVGRMSLFVHELSFGLHVCADHCRAVLAYWSSQIHHDLQD